MTVIKSICFHAGGDLRIAKLYKELAKHLSSNYEIQAKFYCYNSVLYNYFLENDYPCVLENKYDELEINEGEKKDLQLFLESLNYVDFHQIYFTEAAFANNSKTKILELKERVFQRIKFIKDVSSSGFNADIFLDFSGDEIAHNIFNIVAKMTGGRLIRWRETVFPERIGFMENELGIWETKKYNVVLPDKESIDYVKGFISEYLEKKKVFWGAPKEREFKLKVNEVVSLYKIFDKKAWLRFIQRSKRVINKRMVKRLYDNIKELNDKTFFYFPLHYPIDSQLTYRGRPFLNQISFALSIVDFIGESDFLLVKEHPHALGAIPYEDLKLLKQHPKVILIQPWENSHDILKRAKCVIVINSTVALEAIFNKVPVISFGKTYFTGHDLFEEFREFYDLYKLYNWKPKYNTDEVYIKLIEFLQLAYHNSYPLPYNKLLQENYKLRNEDMIKFGDYLMNYIKKT